MGDEPGEGVEGCGAVNGGIPGEAVGCAMEVAATSGEDVAEGVGDSTIGVTAFDVIVPVLVLSDDEVG